MYDVQGNLHRWGRANRVSFDAAKESFHIIYRVSAAGSNFTLLGVNFDCKLTMDTALHEICLAASWKAKAILRTNRFFSTRHLITIFKSHVLGFIEYRTPAIIHAASSVLKPIDLIFDRFLSAIGISAVNALIHFNLASLSIRRDIAALGIIHRAMLGKGPFHLRQFFIRDSNPSRSHPRLSRRRHSFQVLEVYDGLHRDYINRSVFGYIWI